VRLRLARALLWMILLVIDTTCLLELCSMSRGGSAFLRAARLSYELVFSACSGEGEPNEDEIRLFFGVIQRKTSFTAECFSPPRSNLVDEVYVVLPENMYRWR